MSQQSYNSDYRLKALAFPQGAFPAGYARVMSYAPPAFANNQPINFNGKSETVHFSSPPRIVQRDAALMAVPSEFRQPDALYR